MYNKYKDNLPENTIFNIMSSLHNANIMTTYEFNSKAVNGCYSNRVTIKNTDFGSNGKGTSKIYALASGYAELIERLQNNMFYLGEHNSKLYDEFGFYYSPDERLINIDKYATYDNSFINYIYGLNNCNNFIEKINFLYFTTNNFNENKYIEQGKILSIPFYSIKNKEVEYLPYNIYSCVYGSNGMSAGNTIEEAMVQGLSEIYERYVNKTLLEKSITPPDVPIEILKKTSIYSIIEEIETSGRYKVIVKDLSLGKKYPVIGTIIIDTFNGNFGFRLGAHPSFEIALERTLTEAFQGRSIDSFISTAKIGTDAQASNNSNILHIFKNGEGFYRESLFYLNPSYEFTPFDDVISMDNGDLLKKMMEPILNSGHDILVRNSNFLDFPALHIIVPNMSEMRNFYKSDIKYFNTRYKISSRIGNNSEFNISDIKRILRYINYIYTNKNLFDANLNKTLSRPINNILISSPYDTPFTIAIMHLSVGNTDIALNILNQIVEYLEHDNYLLVKAMILCINLIKDGKSKENISQVLIKLYKNTISSKALEYVFNPMNIISDIFQNMKCWNCDNCKFNQSGKCKYKETYKIFYNLRTKMKYNMPNQEKLKTIFNAGSMKKYN